MSTTSGPGRACLSHRVHTVDGLADHLDAVLDRAAHGSPPGPRLRRSAPAPDRHRTPPGRSPARATTPARGRGLESRPPPPRARASPDLVPDRREGGPPRLRPSSVTSMTTCWSSHAAPTQRPLRVTYDVGQRLLDDPVAQVAATAAGTVELAGSMSSCDLDPGQQRLDAELLGFVAAPASSSTGALAWSSSGTAACRGSPEVDRRVPADPLDALQVAAGLLGSRSISVRPTPAWTLMATMAWATTSCTSRRCAAAPRRRDARPPRRGSARRSRRLDQRGGARAPLPLGRAQRHRRRDERQVLRDLQHLEEHVVVAETRSRTGPVTYTGRGRSGRRRPSAVDQGHAAPATMVGNRTVW